jgi:hypothetical protein
MSYDDVEAESTQWNELVNLFHRYKRDWTALVEQVRQDHDDGHAGNIRWCSATACRMAAGWLRR